MEGHKRVVLTNPAFGEKSAYSPEKPWSYTSNFPARWLRFPAGFEPPGAVQFRCGFTLDTPTVLRLHVTADERYCFYIDGNEVGRGSERGDFNRWFYESYDMPLPAGQHIAVAVVWALGIGKLAPWAQMSICPGFLCCPEPVDFQSKLATGIGPWEIRPFTGLSFREAVGQNGQKLGIGPSESIDGSTYPWSWEHGEGDGWQMAKESAEAFQSSTPFSTRKEHWLQPASLPSLELGQWKRFRITEVLQEPPGQDFGPKLHELFAGESSLAIPPFSTLRAVIDLEEYVCAYPHLRFQGGAAAEITLAWTESVRDSATQGCGGTDEGSTFFGPADQIFLDGREGSWRSLWWRCGCFLELKIVTKAHALTVTAISLQETRYPFAPETALKTSDDMLGRVFNVCIRTWQVCSHDLHMDCPYYEQLMYAGDARIQALLTYVLSADARLPRRCLQLFNSSRINPTGLVTGSHPSGGGQLIPPFALSWIGMVRDLALWRDEQALVRRLLPGIRTVLEYFVARMDDSALLRSPDDWNFLDWAFEGGVPPGGGRGQNNSALQAQLIIAFRQAAELEDYVGAPEIANRWRYMEEKGADALLTTFWSETKGAISDDPSMQHYSEHSQCLGLLTGCLPPQLANRVLDFLEEQPPDTKMVSSYFSHYLFEALLLHGRTDVFLSRLQPWRDAVTTGVRTFPETFGETRSECHAWSAHPLYHYLTGVLGIRPTGLGFGSVKIQPRLGELSEAAGTLPHPFGNIMVRFRKLAATFQAEIELPHNLAGKLVFEGRETTLFPGSQRLCF